MLVFLKTAVSNAQVAPYPFTTVEPNLGTVEYPDGGQLVVADIPGVTLYHIIDAPKFRIYRQQILAEGGDDTLP